MVTYTSNGLVVLFDGAIIRILSFSFPCVKYANWLEIIRDSPAHGIPSISVRKPFPWDSIWPIHPFRIWFFNGRHTKCFHAIYAYLRSRMPLIEPNAIKHFKICAATLTFDGHPSTSIWLHRIVLLDELWVKCRMRSFNSLCHWGALFGNKNSSGKSHRF